MTDVIRPNQAGFIPGRKITGQTKPTKMTMHYAEATKQNGPLVALDQEKAYHKIDHTYLWRTMRAFNIPEAKSIQHLYKGAETRVMINGKLSSPCPAFCGVRRGNPSSCLLFDIAVEPVAEVLRLSTLRGFTVRRWLCGEAPVLLALRVPAA